MAVIRKAAIAIAAPALLVALGGTATAEPETTAALPSCPANYGCFYNVNDQKCQWTNNNTQHANDCSWAGNTDGTGNVRTITNRKSSYLCFYRFPNYSHDLPRGWVAPNTQITLPGSGFKVLSHRWVANPANC